MTESRDTEFTCDKCGFTERTKATTKPDGWALLYGPFLISNPRLGSVHTCPTCTAVLAEWFSPAEVESAR